MSIVAIDGFIEQVESDVVAAVTWIENEVEEVVSTAVNAILMPFVRAVEPVVISDLETVLQKVLAEAGIAAIDYFSGKSLEPVITDLLNGAESLGISTLKALTPAAMQALTALKALENQVVADVKAVL